MFILRKVFWLKFGDFSCQAGQLWVWGLLTFSTTGLSISLATIVEKEQSLSLLFCVIKFWAELSLSLILMARVVFILYKVIPTSPKSVLKGSTLFPLDVSYWSQESEHSLLCVVFLVGTIVSLNTRVYNILQLIRDLVVSILSQLSLPG